MCERDDTGATPVALTNSAVSDKAMTVIVSSSDTNLNTIAWTLSGTTGSNTVSGSAAGSRASINIVPQFSGTLTITATDKAGNSVVQSRSFVVDSSDPEPPTVSGTTAHGAYTSGNWTNEDVTLTVTGGGTPLSGITGYEYAVSTDGTNFGSWTTYPARGVAYSANQTTYFKAHTISGSGHISNPSDSYTVNIDKTTPGLSVVYQNAGGTVKSGVTVSGRLWFDESMQLKVTAAPTGGSPIASITYRIGSGAETALDAAQAVNTVTVPDDIADTITVTVTTAAGRTAIFTTAELGVDKEAPSFSIGKSVTDWTNGNVILTVTASDGGSGLVPNAYSFDSGAWTTDTTKEYSANAVSDIRVRDAVGNIGEESYAITNIDKTKPGINSVAAADYTPGTWTNGSVTLTIVAADDSAGIPGTQGYSFDGGATWQDSASYTFGSNMNRDVVMRVKDRAGNESPDYTVNVKIDKTLPTISSVTAAPSGWTDGNVTVTAAAADDSSGVSGYSFDGGENWQDGNTKTYSGDRNETVTVKIRDAAGNITTATAGQSVPVRIDTIDPVIVSVSYEEENNNTTATWLSNWSMGLFFKIKTKVTVTASDLNLKTLSWSISGSPINGGDATSGTTSQSSVSFYVSPQFSGTVTATATDMAGNTATYSRDNIVVDSSAPTQPAISVNGVAVTDGAVMDWTSGSAALSVSGGSALSGIKGYQYRSYEPGTDGADTPFEDYTGTINVSGNTSSTYEFRAVSNSGNKGVKTTVTLHVMQSISAPELSIDGSLGENGWYKQGTTLAINNTQDYGSAQITLQYWNGSTWISVADGGSVPVVEGEHTYRARAIGISGAVESPETVENIKIENAAVTVSVTSEPAFTSGGWTNGDVVFSFSGTATSGIEYYTNGETTLGSPYTVTQSGSYVFRAVSRAGNVSEATSYTVNIDRSVPATVIALKPAAADAVSPNYGTDSGADIFTITPRNPGSGESNITTYYQVDSGAKTAFTGSNYPTGLSQGAHTVYAWGENAAGTAETKKSVTFTVDTSKPTGLTAAANPSGWTAGSVTVTAQAADYITAADGLRYSFDGGAWQTGSKTYSLNTDSTVTVRVMDLAGNIGDTSVQVNVRIDSVIPPLTDSEVSLTADGSAYGGDWTAYDVYGGVRADYMQAFGELHITIIWTAVLRLRPHKLTGWTQISGNTFTLTGNPDLYCHVVSVLGAGLKSSVVTKQVRIDNVTPVSPTLTVTGGVNVSGVYYTASQLTVTPGAAVIPLSGVKDYLWVNNRKIDAGRDNGRREYGTAAGGAGGRYEDKLQPVHEEYDFELLRQH